MVSGAQVATTRVIQPGTPDDAAVTLARRAGLDLDPWQAEIITESSRMNGDTWAAFENVVLAPRQNGKSFLVAARVLAGALLYGEKLILYSAHEYRTAQEVWRTLRELCEDSDFIRPVVKSIARGAGRETIEFINGARFKLIARTKTSGRGMSPDCLLLDEAFSIDPDSMASVLPSLSARPNPQVYYLSSAGTWQSTVLLDLRKRGHVAAERLSYWEWHAEQDDDHADPAVWAKANPAFGHRLSHNAVSRERASMSKRSFARERLGIWTESFAETVLDSDRVYQLTVPAPPPPIDGRTIGWGVDVSSDRASSAICASFESDGQPVVVLVDARPGAGWVPGRLAELHAAYGLSDVCYDSHGGILDVMDRVEREYEIPTSPLKFTQYPAACAALTQAVFDGTVRFGHAPPLLSDCTGATSRPMTNGWVWDRRGLTPPTHLIAGTCALWSYSHGADGSGIAIF